MTELVQEDSPHLTISHESLENRPRMRTQRARRDSHQGSHTEVRVRGPELEKTTGEARCPPVDRSGTVCTRRTSFPKDSQIRGSESARHVSPRARLAAMPSTVAHTSCNTDSVKAEVMTNFEGMTGAVAKSDSLVCCLQNRCHL